MNVLLPCTSGPAGRRSFRRGRTAKCTAHSLVKCGHATGQNLQVL